MSTALMHDTTRLARTTDPVTSHRAAEQVELFRRKHADVIYAALDQHGAMTVDEIAHFTGLQSQQINKRLPELEAKGRARPTMHYRPSRSGRDERVWMAVRR